MATTAIVRSIAPANTTLPSMSRRSFVAGLAVVPIAACAAPAVATAPAEWTALLAEKDRALKAFELAFDAHSDAQQRYYDTQPEEPKAIVKPSAVDSEGVIFFDAERFNADWATAKAAHAEADAEAMRQSGWEETEAAQRAASDAHQDVMRRMLALPTTNPDIIAEKLDLIIQEYGDEMDGVAVVIQSLKGSAA